MKDEGPKEMTLDEWKAMQDKERAKVEFNIRKVNEGEEWQKGFVLHKSKAGVSWSRGALCSQPVHPSLKLTVLARHVDQ